MSISPKEFRDALQINVDKLEGEPAQRNSVAKGLAALGHRVAPHVVAGKLDGQTIRLYVWAGTPAGDVILATGPGFLPKIVHPSEIQQQQEGIYILAGKDTTKAAAGAARAAERYRAPRVSADSAPARRVAAARPAQRERAARAIAKSPRVAEAAPPSVAHVAVDEPAELVASLKALLG